MLKSGVLGRKLPVASVTTATGIAIIYITDVLKLETFFFHSTALPTGSPVASKFKQNETTNTTRATSNLFLPPNLKKNR